MMQDKLQKTPLYDCHKENGGFIAPFGDWLMPIRFSSTLKEHRNVRSDVGIFDVSHMGEIRVSGPEAPQFLDFLLTGVASQIEPGESSYSLLCNSTGGVLDDLIAYRVEPNSYLLCVNAGNTASDYKWILANARQFDVSIVNESAKWSQIAVQGPRSLEVLEQLFKTSQLGELSFSQFKTLAEPAGPVIVARTGYTGEHGYEIYLSNDSAVEMWQKLLTFRDTHNLVPVGLGARDTLRLEACYLLHGQDMGAQSNPYELGLGWTIKLDKTNFVGKEALIAKKADTRQLLRAFRLLSPGVPRSGMTIKDKTGRTIGEVTSGSFLPSLNKPGGLALLDKAVNIGDSIVVEIRDKAVPAEVVKKPLWEHRYK